MHFSLPGVRYNKPAQKAAFMEELIRRVRAVPGVETAGLISTAPGQGRGADFLISVLEHPPRANGAGLDFLVRAADPGYFAAAGIPILRGRAFASWERLDHAGVVLISREAANRFFPNEDPLGKHLRIDYTGKVFRIIGVVGDTRWTVSQPDDPTLYMPLFGNDFNFATLLVRSTRHVEALAIPIQHVISTMDRDLPVSNVETLRETIGKSTLGSEVQLASRPGLRGHRIGPRRCRTLRCSRLSRYSTHERTRCAHCSRRATLTDSPSCPSGRPAASSDRPNRRSRRQRGCRQAHPIFALRHQTVRLDGLSCCRYDCPCRRRTRLHDTRIAGVQARSVAGSSPGVGYERPLSVLRGSGSRSSVRR